MTNKIIPLTINGINDSIYAGFWTRFTASLLDIIILLPYFLLLQYLNSLNINAYYFTFIPSLVFQFWFSTYLVKKYGGTPGKLFMGIKIVKMDGNEITWREAILRDFVSIILMLFSSLITIYALSDADIKQFESLTWLKKTPYLTNLNPSLYKFYYWTINFWTLSELVVLLLNQRKRALHDFIANTVIVKSIYLEKIREIMEIDRS